MQKSAIYDECIRMGACQMFAGLVYEPHPHGDSITKELERRKHNEDIKMISEILLKLSMSKYCHIMARQTRRRVIACGPQVIMKIILFISFRFMKHSQAQK